MAKIEFTKLDQISDRPISYMETPVTIESNHIESYFPMIYGNKIIDDNVTVITTSSTPIDDPLLVKGSYVEIKQLIEQTNNPQS